MEFCAAEIVYSQDSLAKALKRLMQWEQSKEQAEADLKAYQQRGSS